MLKKKLSLPAAWDSKALKDDEWVVQISQGLNDELVQAVFELQSKGLDWEHSVLEDYELPRWTDVIAQIQQRLEGGLGFLLLRGVSYRRDRSWNGKANVLGTRPAAGVSRTPGCLRETHASC